MAVIQPRPTHILYQCAKCGDDRTSFNVICDVCQVLTCNNSMAYLINWTDNFFQIFFDFNGVNVAKHWHVAVVGTLPPVSSR